MATLSLQEGLSACCKTIVHQVNSLNAPNQYNINKHNGFLQALQSPQNLAGADSSLLAKMRETWGKQSINGLGGSCVFKVEVEKPNCDAAGTTRRLICSNSNTTHPTDRRLQYNVAIESVASMQGYLTLADFQCLCNGTQSDVFNRTITQAMQSILKTVNDEAVAKGETGMGAYTTGVESLTVKKDLNLHSSVNGNFQVQPVGWSPLLLEYEKMQTSGGVIAVGGDMAFQYATSLALTRSVTGEYHVPQGISLYYDPAVQALADETWSNPLLTWAPGAIVLLRYMDNFNSAENHINGANVQRAILTYQGHDFDFVLQVDPSCETIRWVINYEWDLFMLPNSAWGTCLETNQRQAYDIDCEGYDCLQLAPIAA